MVWFYGISTIVGYLMPNLVFSYTLSIGQIELFDIYTGWIELLEIKVWSFNCG